MFLRGTSRVEALRHYIQHIDNEVGSHATPLWGSISWVAADNPLRSFTLTPSTLHLRQTSHGMIFDTHYGKPISNLLLTVGKHTIPLTDVVTKVNELDEFFSEMAQRIAVGDAANYDYREGATVFRFEMRLGKKKDAPPS